MPSATRIHKEIARALQEHIIPPLWRQMVPMACVAPPFDFPEGIRASLINHTVPRPDAASTAYPIQTRWPKALLHATFHPYIGFIYQGAAHEHTLVNNTQASQFLISKGIYAIHWRAPGVLLFPSGTARNSGYRPYWDGPQSPPKIMKILWLENLGTEMLLHTHIEIAGQPMEISHSLQVHDVVSITLIRLFTEELQKPLCKKQGAAPSILLAAMSRLHSYLQEKSPKIANTSRPATLGVEAVTQYRQPNAIWQEAVTFIQMHLHESLSLPRIAQRVHLSPTHLNRLFHQFSSVPVMRYVRLQRIAAAKNILIEGSENISEIANLLNFKRPNAFCSAFRRETGLTPNQFRRQARHTKTTP